MNYFKLPLIYALLLQNANAQVTIQPSTKVNIEGGTFLATTGNIVSAVDITGAGTLVMKGSVLQQLNMNGLTIPNLRIENPNNIMLSSSVQVNTLLTFISGKILTGNNLLTLRTGATISGAAAGKFVETNGTGQLRKILAANVTNFLLPLGNGSNYTPVTVSSSGTYSSASVSVNCLGVPHPNKPPAVANYLNTFWSVKRSGITGTVTAVANYTTANIVGNEAAYRGFLWNGATWTNSGVTMNTTANNITANITGAGADVYAMNDLAAATMLSKQTREPADSIRVAQQLYPNPANSTAILPLTIEKDGMTTISILDATGRAIHMESIFLYKGVHHHILDLQSLANGSYVVFVQSTAGSKSYKLIKQ